jgi:hypothetical protein
MAFEIGKQQRGSGSTAVSLTDYRYLRRELNKIDPDINKRMRQRQRQIATPAQRAVKKSINSKPLTSGRHVSRPQRTISGFYPRVEPGRLTWGAGKPAKSVLIDTKVPKARSRGFNSIVRLRVQSPATVVSDMAGSVNKFDRRPVTPVYPYKGGQRKHRNNGQGRGMVAALNKRGKASRFIWPAFDAVAPQVQAEGIKAIDEVVDVFNQMIRRNVA